MSEQWKSANVGESEYWQIYTAEVDTLKHQEQYMDAMGIHDDYFHAPDNSLNMSGLNVLDVGGGPSSILLRTNKLRGNQHDGVNHGVVIDPLIITEHQKLRYDYYGIEFIQDQSENIDQYYSERGYFDECFIYNCLQHVVDPIEILDKVTSISKRIRIAEPLNIPTDSMHLHMFTKEYFDNYFSESKFEVHQVNVERIGSCHHYVGLFSIK
jgi:ubiquinone/menaquinone biosynthesis C-methylase UbiE